ncbi:dehydrogenase/reductase SDR family member on chromosome X, partial [Peromyscus eremicus]|uniref:dehydrogenase/reductase SDR family member on chromosome X n=1 Tax=Peromyscus eremicus TaxID=42410 RepID=UPI0027DBCA08
MLLRLLRDFRAALLAYAVGAAVLLSQLLRRCRGGFREPALPPQPDRVAIVTGGTDGIGLATARHLARLGMRVVIAGNNADKAQDVVRGIRAETGNEKVDFLFLDLASLASVRKFARDFLSLGFPLHVLVNNAGVMLAPRGSTTADGFERHLGVNFLGHFLLTQLLLGALRAAGSRGRRARVVCLGSATHYVGALDPGALGRNPADSPHAAYARSKLALVVFSRRLQRLLAARGDPVTANVADPGVVDT